MKIPLFILAVYVREISDKYEIILPDLVPYINYFFHVLINVNRLGPFTMLNSLCGKSLNGRLVGTSGGRSNDSLLFQRGPFQYNVLGCRLLFLIA